MTSFDTQQSSKRRTDDVILVIKNICHRVSFKRFKSRDFPVFFRGVLIFDKKLSSPCYRHSSYVNKRVSNLSSKYYSIAGIELG